MKHKKSKQETFIQKNYKKIWF